MAGKARRKSRSNSVRRQKPLPGGRDTVYIAVDPAVAVWLHREAARFGCSLSMVGNNAMAWVGNIDLLDPLKRKSR